MVWKACKLLYGKVFNERVGHAVADVVSRTIGSWWFVIIQTAIIASWLMVNLYSQSWDPYPFVALGLYLTFQTACTGPLILMAQNKQGDADSEIIQKDYDLAEASFKSLESITGSLMTMQELMVEQSKIMRDLAESDHTHKGADDDEQSNTPAGTQQGIGGPAQ